MKTARKTFAIILLVLVYPIWLLQLLVRGTMSYDIFFNFIEMAKDMDGTQLLEFDEVYNAGRFLNSIAGFAKFFEAFMLIFGIVGAVYIIRNAAKQKITFIPGCVLLVIIFFNLICFIAGRAINNIEIIDLTADILRYKNFDVDLIYPVINTRAATASSALLSIPAIGFITCGIIDILHLKKNPELAVETPENQKVKKANLFYLLSAASVVALLVTASFISASSNISTIGWIFRYFWQGYIFFIIAAIVFYIIGNNINPIKRVKKSKNTPVQESVQQVSPADELKKYKELYDQGIITQEEFDAKKKQLLGL